MGLCTCACVYCVCVCACLCVHVSLCVALVSVNLSGVVFVCACVCLFMRVTKGNSESGESTEGTEDPREMGKWKDRENEWVKEARSGEASAQGQRQRAEGRERRMDTGGEERRATGMPGLRISGVSKCPWGAQM